MGNLNCHSTKQTRRKISRSQSSFDLNLILIELNTISTHDEDLSKVNIVTILNELKTLNACSIAIQQYALNNFNVPLANVLCATCFR
jgi:hypothetical protein